MKVLKTILLGGAIAGALDIAYAFIVYGPVSYRMTPTEVLHTVASGWMGRDAANAGGAATALLGGLTHFMIAFIMAAIYVGLTRVWPVLGREAVVAGLGYGFVLYLVMTYVVVPLSATHTSQRFATGLGDAIDRLKDSFGSIRPADRWQLVGTLFTHMVFVGLAISLVTRRRNHGR